jgi:hypothetical protein
MHGQKNPLPGVFRKNDEPGPGRVWSKRVNPLPGVLEKQGCTRHRACFGSKCLQIREKSVFFQPRNNIKDTLRVCILRGHGV